MNKRAGSVLRVATPVRAWTQRFALLLLVIAAIALMILGRTEGGSIERARMLVADAVAPVLDLASRPVATVRQMGEQASQMIQLAEENAALRAENERLTHWQAAARQLEAENQGLKAMLNLAPAPGSSFITARVIGDQGGAFVRSVLVNAGERQGVVRGQAAITGDGLAGRVAETGARISRILLITDMNSRIPVMVGEGRERAILAGDNTGQPAVLYLPPRVEVKPGDRVVTSGHGGVFPPGLGVGQIATAGEEGVRVQPYVDLGRIEYLRLMGYELPGILRSFDEGAPAGSGR